MSALSYFSFLITGLGFLWMSMILFCRVKTLESRSNTDRRRMDSDETTIRQLLSQVNELERDVERLVEVVMRENEDEVVEVRNTSLAAPTRRRTPAKVAKKAAAKKSAGQRRKSATPIDSIDDQYGARDV